MQFSLNREKSVATLLYVVSTLREKGIEPNIHKVMKVVYFADQKHIVKYGRPITGDTYLKMDFGPVPSFVNNIANDKVIEFEGVTSRQGNIIHGNMSFDQDELSESDLECINESINENFNASFDELTKKSHDPAWDCSDWQIDYLDIAKAGGADDAMLPYLKERVLNDNLSFSCR